MPVDSAHGATITFGTSFFAQITSISMSGMSRGDIETTHSATTGAQTFMPTDLYDGGELSVEGHFDSTKSWLTPLTAVPESTTLTMPLAAGQTVAASAAFSGYLKSFQFGGPTDNSPQAVSFSAVIKVADDIVVTPAS